MLRTNEGLSIAVMRDSIKNCIRATLIMASQDSQHFKDDRDKLLDDQGTL